VASCWKELIERLRQWGYQAVVCYGAQEAIDAIQTYLGIE
jgi:ADP-heptose:LPS heptosyltransferase